MSESIPTPHEELGIINPKPPGSDDPGVEEYKDEVPVEKPTNRFSVNKAVIENLEKVLDSKRKEAFEKRMNASTKISIETSGDEIVVNLPELIFSEDNYLGMAVAALASRTPKIDIRRLVDRGVELIDSDWIENFLIGVGFGIQDDRVTRLDRSKRGIEQGRAFSYALRVHGEFSKPTHPVGLKGLKKDNYFFGNNAGEKGSKGESVKFGLKPLFTAIFKDQKEGLALYEIFSKLLHRQGLENHSDEEYEHAMRLYTSDFDEYIKVFNRTVTVPGKGGKRTKKNIGRPNKPNRSPLFLKGESKIIQDLLTPLWEDLDHFKKKWLDFNKKFGWESTTSQVNEIMNHRFKTLESYSRVTTDRLNAVRARKADTKLKKADVDREGLSASLCTRTNPLLQGAREILSIVPKSLQLYCINKGLRANNAPVLNETEAILVIENLLYPIYGDAKIIDIERIKLEELDFSVTESDYARAVALTNGIFSRLSAMKGYLQSIQRYKSKANVIRSVANAKNMLENIKISCDDLNKFDPTLAAFVWREQARGFPTVSFGGHSSVDNWTKQVDSALHHVEHVELSKKDLAQFLSNQGWLYLTEAATY